MTYPDAKVIGFLNEFLVPLQIKVDDAGDLGERYNLRWTPHLVVLNAAEKVAHMATGWMSPAEFVPWVMMGLAKASLIEKDWGAVKRHGQEIIDQYPGSFAAPQAVYYCGVSSFRVDHDAKHLKELLATLQKDYPKSEWAMRAWPYGKL
ncbi:MAG: hypothetical protein AB1814_15860 [Thermodesulfobacteriota bacterium]